MPDYSKAYIYIGKCNAADLVYVGSATRSLGVRTGEHRKLANPNNSPLYAAMREFGADKFAIRLIEDFPCANKFHLEQREFEIIKAYPRDKLYNKEVVCSFKRPDTGLDPKYRRGKIYVIVNSVNDMVYIGSTIQEPHSRMAFHKILAKGVDSPLYVAMRKYGVDTFEFSILERYPCRNKEELELHEMTVIQRYPPNTVLNTTVTYGQHSSESKAKITQGLLALRDIKPVTSTAIIMTDVPRTGTTKIEVSRGCIYDAKAMKVWRFEWTTEAGKVKTKNATYGGNRTYEEAYRLCVAAQNKIFPPEGTAPAPEEPETPLGFPNRLKLTDSLVAASPAGYSVTELRDYCREAKLRAGGSKVPLAESLLKHYYSPEVTPSPPLVLPDTPTKSMLFESVTSARNAGYQVAVLTYYCRKVGLIVSGNKAVIAQRLLDHHHPEIDRTASALSL